MIRLCLPCVAIVALLICISTFRAPEALAGDEWRPVTPEELALKAARVETDADAEAIFWEVRIDDSWAVC